LGVKIGDIIPEEAVEKSSLQKLSGKSVALDAYNILYQFIATIRGPDGRPLMDRRGRITSHLSGLFFRDCQLPRRRAAPRLCLRRPAAGAQEKDNREEEGVEDGGLGGV
jgi:hypothetical protein